ncbi:hypothetical protein VP1G_00937 [Cytospora mali]|uniref:Uncharacterized protein n=1 Tax=Cytospora mali TaxID=578113 RepID=A0A194UPH2_CYTMA|nr:hypothetical protein VP1G_00937 [Valsa mali var. pyri (nom. inval.)]
MRVMDEKPLPPPRPKRFNAVGFCLTAIRIWQWSSSFFVYASFSLLYEHIQRNRLGENDRMKEIQVLGLVSLVYSTTVVCCVHILKTLDIRIWRVFAIMSLPGDLTIMGICLAKITILSFSGLPADCHGLTRDNYDGNDLVRQPADGFTTIRFGSWSHDLTGELDELCTFPQTVYGLSVAAIFSYTFSILLTVLYLQQHEPELFEREKAIQRLASYDEESASQTAATTALRDLHRHLKGPSILLERPSVVPHLPTTAGSQIANLNGHNDSIPSSRTPSFTTSPTQSVSAQACSTWDATTQASDADSIHSGISLPDSASIISGGSLPPPPVPGSSAHQPQRRWSNSTNSSYNANAFIVTDGFRPGNEPPLYSSRPGSLYHENMKYEAGLGFPNCSPAP